MGFGSVGRRQCMCSLLRALLGVCPSCLNVGVRMSGLLVVELYWFGSCFLFGGIFLRCLFSWCLVNMTTLILLQCFMRLLCIILLYCYESWGSVSLVN